MKSKYLIEKMPFLNKLNNERKQKFLEYFSNAPLWLLDSMNTVKFEEGVSFIKEGEKAQSVFFLITGVVEAVDLRMYGAAFNYKHFYDVYAFGGMEIIMGINNYMTTLQTVTSCTFVKVPRSLFEKWLYSDLEALKRESRMVAKNLLDEGRNNRLYLFTQGSDRVALLLIRRYEYYNVDGILKMDYDRQGIADASGVCIKTVSRSIKYFTEQELITKDNSDIIINNEQYERMKEIVSRVVDI